MKALMILAIIVTPLYADVSGEDDVPTLTPQEQNTPLAPLETAPPQTIEKEEGTTPVVEKEVAKLPEDAKQKSNINWGNIIMAASAVVVAVVALVLVGKNSGRHK